MSPATVDTLRDWEDAGAVWRAVSVGDERVVVDLCACTGEPQERVESDDPAVIAYVRERGGASS